MRDGAKINLAILASGSGSNALKIIEYFKDNDLIRVALVLSNKENAGVLNHAQDTGIPSIVVDKSHFTNRNQMLATIEEYGADYIILAGFLWKIPSFLIEAFEHKILNIHPSLLPKYGGKGMYGIHVHRAVKTAGDLESGMTIHLVNEQYDKGKIIFQDRCELTDSDSPEDIAAKVLVLEHLHYAHIIEAYILDRLTS